MQQLFKTSFIRHNGSFIPRDEASDHTVTHSLHYGGAVFEGIRFYKTDQGPKIFRLKEHIERLLYSASVLQMNVPYSKEELIQATIDTVAKNGEEEGYIRPIIYYGKGAMGLAASFTNVSLEVSISVWKRGKYLSSDPIRVKISHIRRVHPSTTDMGAKIAGNYANSILAGLDTKGAGYDEGLLLDTTGCIAEGPGENIFFVQGNHVVTPAVGSILPGITRSTVMELLADYQGKVAEETCLIPRDLASFDEAFFTGTAAEVTPIGSITLEDGTTIPYRSGEIGSVTQRIKDLYDRVVHGKEQRYMHRLW